MTGPPPGAARDDPFAVLGLPPGATVADVVAARRRLAKSAHPDAGGSAAAMQRLNAAAEAALALLAGDRHDAPARSTKRAPAPRRSRRPDRAPRWTDHPSFTIEALPVDAFEALLLVAGQLGDLLDDDPPYGLEVALGEPLRGWCRLDLVPDAGASTVSLSVAPEPGYPLPDIDLVRDHWVAGLNGLDWEQLEPDA